MCWCFNFGFSSSKNQKSSSSSSSQEKKRRDKRPQDALHGQGKSVAATSTSGHSKEKRRSGESQSPRSPRRERERTEHRPRSQRYEEHGAQRRDDYRPSLKMQVPDMYHRSVLPEESPSSSQEALLNPRPHRSQHTRQRHPKRTSQTTLRGRGAKRDPPKHSKSKKNLRSQPSKGWSFFAPSPPKTPSRSHRNYQTLDSSPRSHRSQRQHQSSRSAAPSESSPSQSRHHRSRQHERSAPSHRQARSRTPNTGVRRVPDRRFAVLAATNVALENVRREAFASPSPPPRRERLRRYEGVTIPASQIPFSWDCVSSSQTSAGYGYRTAGEASSSSRQRRSRR